MRRVVIMQRRLTHYRVPLFELMRRKLNDSDIQLEVVYGDPTEEERLKSDEGKLDWGVYVPCRYFLNGRLCWQDGRPVVQAADLVIVTQENKLLFNFWLLLFRRKGIAYWGHGRNFQAKTSSSWSEWFKRRVSRTCDWWFAYTAISAQVIRDFGFREDRITALNNSIDTDSLRKWIADQQRVDIRVRRAALGIGSGPVGIVIASLHAEKRIQFLLEAASQLKSKIPNFELVIIGDGPERELVIRAMAEGRDWIHWPGAKTGVEKAKYLALADVMLNPGMVGLGILDSFAAGLPIITTDCGIHSPEIAYLRNGLNGLITLDSKEDFVEKTLALVAAQDRRAAMRQECLDDSIRFDLLSMANNFCLGITKALELQVVFREGESMDCHKL